TGTFDAQTTSRGRCSPPKKNMTATAIPVRQRMDIPFDLIINAVIAGLLLGGFYAAVTAGISISFSMLVLPAFYALGGFVYQVYYVSFEKYGQESLRGLAFFFGLLFVTEVCLLLIFGVDYRSVDAAYIGSSVRLGTWEFPLRLLVPCLTALAMFAGLQIFL